MYLFIYLFIVSLLLVHSLGSKTTHIYILVHLDWQSTFSVLNKEVFMFRSNITYNIIFIFVPGFVKTVQSDRSIHGELYLFPPPRKWIYFA